MASEAKDPAEVRREKLQALRERREQAAPKDGAGAGAAGGGARRAAADGAGGRGAFARQLAGEGGGAKLLEELKNNPEKRAELLERFPQLRERLEGGQGRGAGAGRGPGGAGGGRGPGAGRGPGGGAGRGPGAGAGRGAGAGAAAEELRKLREQVAQLNDTLRQTRKEVEELRSERAAPVARVRRTSKKTSKKKK